MPTTYGIVGYFLYSRRGFLDKSKLMDSGKELQLIASHLRIALRCIEQQQQVMTMAELVELLDMHVGSAAELLALLRGEGGDVLSVQERRVTESRKVGSGNTVVSQKVEQPSVSPCEEKSVATKPALKKTEEQVTASQKVTLPNKTAVDSRMPEVLVQDGGVHQQASIREKDSSLGKKESVKSAHSGAVGGENAGHGIDTKQPREHVRGATTLADAYAQRAAAIVTTNDNAHVEESLGSRLSPLASIQKGLTLYDKSFFAVELFQGNRALFSEVVKELDAKTSLSEALQTLERYYTGAPDLPALKDFIQILERRFS